MYISDLSKVLFLIWIFIGVIRAVFFCLMIYNREPDVKWFYWKFYIAPPATKAFFTEKGLYFRRVANILFLLFTAISIALAISLIFY